MTKIHLDFETYSEGDIRSLGAWAYAKHPTTEVICLAYAIDDDEPKLWLPGDDNPAFIGNLTDYELHAWNSFFEYCIWHHVLGWPEVSVKQWHDTAALAAALAMPRKLGDCGAALGIDLDQQKNKRGRYLIQRLSKPNRGERIRDIDLLQEMYDYCCQDVIAERAIARRLHFSELQNIERAVWELDQTINIRGVPIDTQAVDDALDMLEQVTETLNNEVSEITDGHLAGVSQRARVMEYIAKHHGYHLETYTKGFLRSVLDDDTLPAVARRLVEIRLQLGKTSTAKYAALKQLVTDDGRAHGLLMYHGASTGRWSGKHFQPQNLPRASFDDTDMCIELFKSRDADFLEMLYGDPMEALSSCLRGMICAPEGNRLIVADYSAIEARVLAWLAGQQDILDVFRGDGRIYEHTASKIYGVPVDKVTKDQRFIGKVATLALGYQGGSGAFTAMAEAYGMEIEPALAEKIKTEWRKVNKHIVKFWYGCEEAAIAAVETRGAVIRVGHIQFRASCDYLFCCLPSKRLLAYYQPRLEPGRFDRDQVTFMGTNSVTRKWERHHTYGGKLVENITQAVARDLMAEAMLRVESAGYPIVLSVHDELIAEVPEGFGSVDHFAELMCELPVWAEGLPISAEGFESRRYRK